MAQTACTFEANGQRRTRLDYLLHVPRGERPAWPLILFLHGSGERGRDVGLVKAHGVPAKVEREPSFGFVTVSPQCAPAASWTRYADVLVGLLDEILATQPVDRERVYLTGISMGGYGAWQLAARWPQRFAAVVPICGGLPMQRFADNIRALRPMPVWAFHGAQDDIVPMSQSQRVIDALRAAGAAPRFTVYPDVGHEAWRRAYDTPELYQWLLDHRLAVGGR